MNILLWTLQALLAILFLMSGVNKLLRSKQQLSTQMHWVEDFSPLVIQLIGGVEVLGAVGLILPALTGILSWLTPLAAAGLALDMVGASLEHIRRGEFSAVGMTGILLVLTAFAAYGRFVILPL